MSKEFSRDQPTVVFTPVHFVSRDHPLGQAVKNEERTATLSLSLMKDTMIIHWSRNLPVLGRSSQARYY
jgi:hypothetical protein